MSTHIPKAFEKIFSLHPHRKARVTLLVVFVILIVVGSLAFFQNMNRLNMPRTAVDPLEKEKAEAIADLQQRLLTSPPVSQAERDKALSELQARLKAQKK